MHDRNETNKWQYIYLITHTSGSSNITSNTSTVTFIRNLAKPCMTLKPLL